MQAECRHKQIIFILPFLLLFFCGLQDYTYSALCFFILSLHVLKFKFAYSIFYIKPRTISVVKCIDIALNSRAAWWSFFVIDGEKQINFQLYSIFNILVHTNCILTRQSVLPASFSSQSSVFEHDSLQICYALSVWEYIESVSNQHIECLGVEFVDSMTYFIVK